MDRDSVEGGAASPVRTGETACVVVGAGAAGVRCARELVRHAPGLPVLLLGAETVQPYDRVRLSSLLAGECRFDALDQAAGLDQLPSLCLRFGETVASIDRESRSLRLASGEQLGYRSLVLATGSRPHVPSIPGTELAGVYAFRDLRDAEALSARRLRSRRTVVLGGGLLGLEAARAMHRFHTEVVVVEHGGRLMPRQLDDAAAARLAAQVQDLGIECVVDDGALQLTGDRTLSGVRLRSGRVIDCDTVVIATGIVPNVRLALDAGLPIGRGIKVDDGLRTADPDIYAIGECAEHRGVVYGLVAPCLEQAAVAASVIVGVDARYLGSVDATRLKVMKTQVFAAGTHPDRSLAGLDRELVFGDEHSYRKLIHRRGKLIGVLGIGEWDELPRALEAVQQARRIGWLRRTRFERSGRLWPQSESASVASWPANATVCNCTGVTRGQLSGAIAMGCATRAALAACTRASTVCGSCAPLLDQLLGGDARPQPVSGGRPLLAMTVIAALVTLLLAMLPGLPYVPSWERFVWHWDVLWRNGLFKQISGYTLAGMAVVGLLISLRKRAPRVNWGSFALWRNLHVGLGVGALLALLLHTGGRLGNGLNAGLMSAFITLIVAGAAAGALIALEHRLSPVRAKRLRGSLTWVHILAFWPLPALLGFHVLKIYYY